MSKRIIIYHDSRKRTYKSRPKNGYKKGKKVNLKHRGQTFLQLFAKMVAFGAWFYNNISVSHASPTITVVKFFAEFDCDRVRAGRRGNKSVCIPSCINFTTLLFKLYNNTQRSRDGH
jgi:hypothetical protein